MKDKKPSIKLRSSKINSRNESKQAVREEIKSSELKIKMPIQKPKAVNEKIFKLLENYITDYESEVSITYPSNGAIFEIFDSFFQNIKAKNDIYENHGVKLVDVIDSNLPIGGFNILDNSSSTNGIAFSVVFDNFKFFVRFTKYRDGIDMVYNISLKSEFITRYSYEFLYKYLLYNAISMSNLKGSYVTMPRNSFSWTVKTLETRTFDDIFLPTEITEDLQLYVDIFDKSGRVLRYLKVGNPGVGKTESTLVIASELLKRGVTIIKTPVCEKLHDKVELANVLSPAMIIFDDIDLSLGDRNKGAYSQLLGDFLDVLDGTDKLAKNVGIIGTTNAAHLLDLAAQRPGRFDKTLLFDNITKDNITNIILKSLRNNFNISKGEEVKLYTNPKIVNVFFNSGVTGSHIYNAIKMLKLRYDTLGLKDITVDKIISGINSEIEVISKIRKVSFLKEKFERSSSIGFNGSNDDIHPSPELTERTKNYN